MLSHLKTFWTAHAAWISGVALIVWPQVREYVCTHPIITASGLVSVVATALVTKSPVTKA